MNRPLLIATIMYIFGIIIGVYLHTSIPFFILVCLLLIAMYIIKKEPNKNKAPIIKKIIISIFIIIISGSRANALNKSYNNLYKKFDGEQIDIIGTVSNIIEKENKYDITINIYSVNGNKEYKNTKLKLSIIKESSGTLYKKFEYGNKVQFIGIYSEPEVSRNYKGYSNKDYLKTKKIYGIIKIENSKGVKVLRENNLSFININLDKLANKIKNNLKEILPEDTLNLAQGILLGDNSNIDNDVKEDFSKSSLSHMLAVSGTHVAYVILVISIILNKKYVGLRKQKIFSIIILIIFMIITGNSPSVRRAVITAIIYIAAFLIHRKQDVISAISLSCLISIIENPFIILDIGFELSYAGTFGIIMFYPLLNKVIQKRIIVSNEKVVSKVIQYIAQSIIVTISANILIMPIVISKFNTISINFILSNLIASPILCLIMISGIITIIISLISIKLARISAIILNLSLKILSNIAKYISKILPPTMVVTPKLHSVIIFYIIVIIIFLVYKNKGKIKKHININSKKTFYIVFISITILINIPKNNLLKIYFIDVGQGDSTLITTPTGKNVLIDGGGSKDRENYDIGEKVLLPYLLDRRIKKVDYIIISHFDADHAQGLEAVLENIKVKNIVISKQPTISEEYKTIISLCKKKNVNIIVVKRGEKIVIDKYVYFSILHPGDNFLDDGKGGLNANAIVAKLNYKLNSQKEFTVLFTGDIEEEAEKELVNKYNKNLKCDVLKVAHHGSKTSSIQEFLNVAKPKIALIGVGKNNTFGHPNGGVIERLNNIGAKIYRTDKMGEIELSIDKNGKIGINYKIKEIIDINNNRRE